MSLKNLSATIKIPKLLRIKLDNKKVTQIYKKFEKSFKDKEKFVVAVSGGPDSLALAFLAKIYSVKNRITSRFLIVDHKIRNCLLYTSPSPRDATLSRMPSSA